jgi:hypothetical protein
MSITEAVVVHQLIAYSEFADDLEVIELSEPVAQKVMSDVQQALAAWIPNLGTDDYGPTVERAYAEIDPGPYRRAD